MPLIREHDKNSIQEAKQRERREHGQKTGLKCVTRGQTDDERACEEAED